MNKKLLLILLFCLLFLPFLNQAFHIDDAGFLALSHYVSWNPLNTAAPGIDPNIYGSTHTVFLPYFMKIIAAVFGESEIAFHVVFLIFPALALYYLIRLNRLLFPQNHGNNAYLLLLFVSVPAFLVSSHTVMSDVPALALLLMSIYMFMRAARDGNVKDHYTGSLLLTLAAFVSYQSLVFVPLVFVYFALNKKLNRHVMISLLMPVIAISAWISLVYEQHGFLPIATGDFTGQGRGIAAEIKRGLLGEVLVGKTINVFATLGASAFFVIIYHTIARNKGPFFITWIAALSITTAILLFPVIPYSPLETVFLSIMAALGMYSLAYAAGIGVMSSQGGERKTHIFLVLWIFVVTAYNLIVMPFGSARYILPALPPMYIILINTAKCEFGDKTTSRIVAGLIACSIVFGIASSYSDYKYADVYRTFTKEAKAFRSTVPKSVTFWYIGRWGMQYYMDRAGLAMLPFDSNEPKKGDYVVIPEMPRFYMPSAELAARLEFFASREFSSWLPLRLFNRRSNAGFYAHHWGLLPFNFSREPDEVFTVWQVVK